MGGAAAKPTKDTPQKKPTDDTPQKKPTDDTPQKKPADDTLQKKPADDTPQKKPADDTPQKKPADDTQQKKPADDTPQRLFEMRKEARANENATCGVPQVAMIRLDDSSNCQLMTASRRFQGENHTEADLLRELEVSHSSQLARPGFHVYLFTENSPCVIRRKCETPCLQLIIKFACRYPNSTVDVGFQRPYGSRTANDSERMDDFIADLWASNHTIGASEPNIPSNLHFHRMNVTSNETTYVHDGL